MITIVPVAKTAVDWDTLQRVAIAVIGRPVTRPLDVKMIQARGLPEAVVSYGEFQQEHVEYTATLREAGSLLKHFSVSFIIGCDDRDLFYQIAIDGDLNILDCDSDRLAIVTGTLERWRTTLINFATHRSTKAQREFAGLVLLQFDKLGLSELWSTYSRSGGRDLILTETR